MRKFFCSPEKLPKVSYDPMQYHPRNAGGTFPATPTNAKVLSQSKSNSGNISVGGFARTTEHNKTDVTANKSVECDPKFTGDRLRHSAKSHVFDDTTYSTFASEEKSPDMASGNAGEVKHFTSPAHIAMPGAREVTSMYPADTDIDFLIKTLANILSQMQECFPTAMTPVPVPTTSSSASPRTTTASSPMLRSSEHPSKPHYRKFSPYLSRGPSVHGASTETSAGQSANSQSTACTEQANSSQDTSQTENFKSVTCFNDQGEEDNLGRKHGIRDVGHLGSLKHKGLSNSWVSPAKDTYKYSWTHNTRPYSYIKTETQSTHDKKEFQENNISIRERLRSLRTRSQENDRQLAMSMNKTFQHKDEGILDAFQYHKAFSQENFKDRHTLCGAKHGDQDSAHKEDVQPLAMKVPGDNDHCLTRYDEVSPDKGLMPLDGKSKALQYRKLFQTQHPLVQDKFLQQNLQDFDRTEVMEVCTSPQFRSLPPPTSTYAEKGNVGGITADKISSKGNNKYPAFSGSKHTRRKEKWSYKLFEVSEASLEVNGAGNGSQEFEASPVLGESCTQARSTSSEPYESISRPTSPRFHHDGFCPLTFDHPDNGVDCGHRKKCLRRHWSRHSGLGVKSMRKVLPRKFSSMTHLGQVTFLNKSFNAPLSLDDFKDMNLKLKSAYKCKEGKDKLQANFIMKSNSEHERHTTIGDKRFQLFTDQAIKSEQVTSLKGSVSPGSQDDSAKHETSFFSSGPELTIGTTITTTVTSPEHESVGEVKTLQVSPKLESKSENSNKSREEFEEEETAGNCTNTFEHNCLDLDKQRIIFDDNRKQQSNEVSRYVKESDDNVDNGDEYGRKAVGSQGHVMQTSLTNPQYSRSRKKTVEIFHEEMEIFHEEILFGEGSMDRRAEDKICSSPTMAAHEFKDTKGHEIVCKTGNIKAVEEVDLTKADSGSVFVPDLATDHARSPCLGMDKNLDDINSSVGVPNPQEPPPKLQENNIANIKPVDESACGELQGTAHINFEIDHSISDKSERMAVSQGLNCDILLESACIPVTTIASTEVKSHSHSDDGFAKTQSLFKSKPCLQDTATAHTESSNNRSFTYQPANAMSCREPSITDTCGIADENSLQTIDEAQDNLSSLKVQNNFYVNMQITSGSTLKSNYDIVMQEPESLSHSIDLAECTEKFICGSGTDIVSKNIKNTYCLKTEGKSACKPANTIVSDEPDYNCKTDHNDAFICKSKSSTLSKEGGNTSQVHLGGSDVNESKNDVSLGEGAKAKNHFVHKSESTKSSENAERLAAERSFVFEAKNAKDPQEDEDDSQSYYKVDSVDKCTFKAKDTLVAAQKSESPRHIEILNDTTAFQGDENLNVYNSSVFKLESMKGLQFCDNTSHDNASDKFVQKLKHFEVPRKAESISELKRASKRTKNHQESEDICQSNQSNEHKSEFVSGSKWTTAIQKAKNNPQICTENDSEDEFLLIPECTVATQETENTRNLKAENTPKYISADTSAGVKHESSFPLTADESNDFTYMPEDFVKSPETQNSIDLQTGYNNISVCHPEGTRTSQDTQFISHLKADVLDEHAFVFQAQGLKNNSQDKITNDKELIDAPETAMKSQEPASISYLKREIAHEYFDECESAMAAQKSLTSLHPNSPDENKLVYQLESSMDVLEHPSVFNNDSDLNGEYVDEHGCTVKAENKSNVASLGEDKSLHKFANIVHFQEHRSNFQNKDDNDREDVDECDFTMATEKVHGPSCFNFQDKTEFIHKFSNVAVSGNLHFSFHNNYGGGFEYSDSHGDEVSSQNTQDQTQHSVPKENDDSCSKAETTPTFPKLQSSLHDKDNSCQCENTDTYKHSKITQLSENTSNSIFHDDIASFHNSDSIMVSNDTPRSFHHMSEIGYELSEINEYTLGDQEPQNVPPLTLYDRYESHEKIGNTITSQNFDHCPFSGDADKYRHTGDSDKQPNTHHPKAGSSNENAFTSKNTAVFQALEDASHLNILDNREQINQPESANTCRNLHDTLEGISGCIHESVEESELNMTSHDEPLPESSQMADGILYETVYEHERATVSHETGVSNIRSLSQGEQEVTGSSQQTEPQSSPQDLRETNQHRSQTQLQQDPPQCQEEMILPTSQIQLQQRLPQCQEEVILPTSQIQLQQDPPQVQEEVILPTSQIQLQQDPPQVQEEVILPTSQIQLQQDPTQYQEEVILPTSQIQLQQDPPQVQEEVIHLTPQIQPQQDPPQCQEETILSASQIKLQSPPQDPGEIIQQRSQKQFQSYHTMSQTQPQGAPQDLKEVIQPISHSQPQPSPQDGEKLTHLIPNLQLQQAPRQYRGRVTQLRPKLQRPKPPSHNPHQFPKETILPRPQLQHQQSFQDVRGIIQPKPQIQPFDPAPQDLGEANQRLSQVQPQSSPQDPGAAIQPRSPIQLQGFGSDIPIDIYTVPMTRSDSWQKKRKKKTDLPTRTVVISGPVRNMSLPVQRHVVPVQQEDRESAAPAQLGATYGEAAQASLPCQEDHEVPDDTDDQRATPKWRHALKRMMPFGKRPSTVQEKVKGYTKRNA